MAKCGCAGGSCSCVVTGGTNVEVTGTGSTTNPYVVTATGTKLTVQDTPSLNLTLTGEGTASNPLVLSGVASGGSGGGGSTVITVQDTPTVDMNMTGLGTLASPLVLSANVIPAPVYLTGTDTATVDLTVTGAGTALSPFVLTANLVGTPPDFDAIVAALVANTSSATRAAIIAAAGGGGGGTPDITPGEVLNIGPGADQNHFAMQIAPDGAASISTFTQAQIAAGAYDPRHFYVTPDGWVGVKPRADGPTTPGSSYARDELREVNADGTNIKFNALVGEHWISGRHRIMHAPANDPDVVIAQLHNGDADRIAIRTQMFSTGTVVLGVRINGALHATRLMNPFEWGVEFAWKIRMIDGTAQIYFNDMNTPVITSTALVASAHPDAWYFKTGAYNQFNEVAIGATGLMVPPTEYSQVEFTDIRHWHSGWAPPPPDPDPEPDPEPPPPPDPDLPAAPAGTLREIHLTTNWEEMQAALSLAEPGDSFIMPNATVLWGREPTIKGGGTATNPISLRGTAESIWRSEDGDYGLHIMDSPYTYILGGVFDTHKKGIVLDNSPYCVLRGVRVTNSEQELVHFRASSHHCLAEDCYLEAAGLQSPAFGEGFYVGSHNGNWSDHYYDRSVPVAIDGGPYGNTAGVDDSSDIILRNNIIVNTTAEGLDYKQGCDAITVEGNAFYACGWSNENSADSAIDCKGSNAIITDNDFYPYMPDESLPTHPDPVIVGQFIQRSCVQSRVLTAPWGHGQTLTNNRAHGTWQAYMFEEVSGSSGNSCNNTNTAPGALLGLSNIGGTEPDPDPEPPTGGTFSQSWTAASDTASGIGDGWALPGDGWRVLSGGVVPLSNSANGAWRSSGVSTPGAAFAEIVVSTLGASTEIAAALAATIGGTDLASAFVMGRYIHSTGRLQVMTKAVGTSTVTALGTRLDEFLTAPFTLRLAVTGGNAVLSVNGVVKRTVALTSANTYVHPGFRGKDDMTTKVTSFLGGDLV